MARVLWNSDIDVYNPKVIPIPVASAIAWHLDIPDLLLFALTSRNAHKAAHDPTLWVLKLRRMGVWELGVPTGDTQPQFDTFSSPSQCLLTIYKLPRLARFQVLQIYRCLHEYYADLQSNLPYERLKIFKHFHTPHEQAQMLTNLLKYNKIDPLPTLRELVGQKITDLIEIFENALLRELEIHFDIADHDKTRLFVEILISLSNHQTLIDFFLQKTCFDNELIKFLNPEMFLIDEFFVESNGAFKLNEKRIDEFIDELASVFNEEARIIDVIFPQSIPMMYKVSEELISNQLQEIVLVLTTAAKEHAVYLEMVPTLYKKLSVDFLEKLNPCHNVGESYHLLVHELIDLSYESFASEYLNEEKLALRQLCAEKILDWNSTVEKREEETTQNILKHVKVETKNDFLSNFRKVFTISGNTDNASSEENEEVNYSKVQANARILAENIKSLKRNFNPELALTILKESKNSLKRLLHFRDFTINSVLSDIYSTMQEEFVNVIDSLSADHLKIGFERALTYLKGYNPKEISSLIDESRGSAIGPLVIFFELINMADMIVQMLDIFYKEEMINLKIVRHENSILNPSLQSKRKMEAMVDKYVADGLNIGIDVLFREIDLVYLSFLRESDYNPPPNTIADGATAAARRAVLVLEDNIDLLVDAAEKSVVEVFQQEVAERFFQVIVKVLKRSTISVDGAVTLISDLNLYYDFILSHIKGNKRMVYPLFQALKKVGTIYLISGDDAKAIGQLVSDLSKFNGIFSQEEIYEFVQRRQDWPVIKKHVEKVMYGLSLGDCTIV